MFDALHGVTTRERDVLCSNAYDKFDQGLCSRVVDVSLAHLEEHNCVGDGYHETFLCNGSDATSISAYSNEEPLSGRTTAFTNSLQTSANPLSVFSPSSSFCSGGNEELDPLGSLEDAEMAMPLCSASEQSFTCNVNSITVTVTSGGRMFLHGENLQGVEPMLLNLCGFRRVKRSPQFPLSQLGALYCRVKELSEEEAEYIVATLHHRRTSPAMCYSQIDPLPANLKFPENFRPIDATGRRMSGPFVCTEGKAENMFRQFFAGFDAYGEVVSFMWADGTGMCC